MPTVMPPEMPPLADLLALAWFVLLWLGYAPAIQHFGLPHGATNAVFIGIRRAWMRHMVARDFRIVDTSLLAGIGNSVSFFASSTILIVAGLAGTLLSVDRMQDTLTRLSFITAVPQRLFELRLMLPMLVMVHGFFKLTWSIRQLNYTLALIGAAPVAPLDSERGRRLGASVGVVLSSAMAAFNAGIRAYAFALAALAWLAGPAAMAGAVTLVTAGLVRRQILSPTARAIQAALADVEVDGERL